MNNSRYGEELFAQLMSANGYIVEDVSNNPSYWDKDIDFVITSTFTNTTKTFEVKWDSRIAQTGNLYLEFISKYSRGGYGWYEFCKADYLAYGDANSKQFIIVDMKQLRDRVDKLPKRIAYCGNDSAGYLVNKSQIADISSIIGG